jgi:hypothetical protein
MIGFIYTSSYIFIFLIGLILTFIVATDFSAIATRFEIENDTVVKQLVSDTQNDIAQAALGVFITGAWFGICIKLQIAYLSSDGANFLAWMINDAMSFIGASKQKNGWLEGSSVNHASVAFMSLLSSAVLVYVLMMTRLGSDPPNFLRNTVRVRVIMIAALFTVNTICAGMFTGFSLLTFLCVLVSLNYVRRQHYHK